MSGEDRVLCPTCGYPSVMEATEEEVAAKRACSPLRCSEWKVVGKATKPHPITGARTMLRVVDDLPSSGSGRGTGK